MGALGEIETWRTGAGYYARAYPADLRKPVKFGPAQDGFTVERRATMYLQRRSLDA